MNNKKYFRESHFWRDLTYAAATLALGALSVLIVRVIFAVPDVTEMLTKFGDSAALLPEMVDGQVAGARGELGQKVDTALGVAQGEIRDTRRAAVQQIAQTRTEMLAEIRSIHEDGIGISVAGLNLASKHASAIEEQINPALFAAETTMNEFNVSQRDLRPQILGLVAASKVLAGESAQAMKVIRDTAPQFIATQEKIAGHIERVTGDVQIMTDRIVKPKTKKEIFLGLLFPAALLGSKFF